MFEILYLYYSLLYLQPTIRDRHGNTALHLACMSGEEQCVRALTMSIGASEVNEAHRQYGHRANDKSYLKCAHLPSDLEIRNYDGEWKPIKYVICKYA